jgi:hypothetical protein
MIPSPEIIQTVMDNIDCGEVIDTVETVVMDCGIYNQAYSVPCYDLGYVLVVGIGFDTMFSAIKKINVNLLNYYNSASVLVNGTWPDGVSLDGGEV